MLNRSCHAAFERSFRSDPKPSYKMLYAYGVPVFRVTFPSQGAFANARDAGHTKSFIAAIQELCNHCGSRDRPYDASRAVEFSCEA